MSNRSCSSFTLATIAAALLFIAPTLPAQTSAQFDLPAQSLVESLRAVGKRTDTNILIDRKLIGRRQAPALKAMLTVDEALTRLLAGTGLKHQFVNEHTVTIVSEADAARPASSGAMAVAPQTSSTAVPAATAESPNHQRVGLEEIVVTGSRLHRATIGPSPVTVVSRQELDRTGATTLQGVFNYLPQASTNRAETNGIEASAALVTLRGLPGGTTAVLINGRRAVTAGHIAFQDGFDLNYIPLAAVDRIEVLTSGASAIYGADAIAGVINVILRKDIEGVTTDLRYGATTDGAQGEYRVGLFGGIDRERFRGSLTLDFYNRDHLPGAERDRSADQDFRRFGGPDRRSAQTNPGNVLAVPGTGNLPGLATTFAAVPTGSTGVGLTPASFAGTAGTRNFRSGSAESDILPATERRGAFATAEFDVRSDVTAFVEYLYSDNEQRFDLLAGLPQRLRVPASNAFNPFGQPVDVDYLFPEAPITDEFDLRFQRALAGVRGRIGSSSWDWDLAYLYTREDSKRTITNSNTLNQTLLTQLLGSSDPATALNPFSAGLPADLTLYQPLFSDAFTDYGSDSRQVDALLRGALLQLPAGPLELAVGAAWHKEGIHNEGIFGQAPMDVSREVSAGYLEAQIPLAAALAVTLAGRYDRYSDFGSNTSPQAGVTWTIAPRFIVRASYSDSFKAPGLFRLNQPFRSFSLGVSDSRRGGESYVIAPAAADGQPGAGQGGNPDLEPEEGRSTNVGLVLLPPERYGLGLTVDWWTVELENRLVSANNIFLIENEALYPELIERGAPTAEDQAAGLPGRIVRLKASYANGGEARLAGADFQPSYSWAAFGSDFTASVTGTYVYRYEASVSPSSPLANRLGQAFIDGYAPRWKAVASLRWSGGPWQLDTAVRYTQGYIDYVLAGFPPRRVASNTLVDVGASYELPKRGGLADGLRIHAGVTNLLDREPPYSNAFGGYDSLQADLVGRFAYINVKKDF